MSLRKLSLSLVIILTVAVAAMSQTPNTGSLVITVVDANQKLVPGASISIVDKATTVSRSLTADEAGRATATGLQAGSNYLIRATAPGSGPALVDNVVLRSGETAELRIKLAVLGVLDDLGDVTIFGTAEGVRSNPQIGRVLTPKELNQAPILGRKLSSVPLLNSAFRQGKGTGDLFVNQTYFITGVGSRRATTFTVDGASNDEGWGRQTAVATIPVGAVQEVNVLSNAFSAEYGWTSGPALNIVTKSGTNDFHGEALFLVRPGGSFQAKKFSIKNFCPPSVTTCVTPSSLVQINPVDIPDKLKQFSGAVGGPVKKDKTFFFVAVDRTHQDRTTYLANTLPAFLLPADGRLDYTGHYRQTLVDGRIDHRLNANHSLMFRVNLDRMFDDNPQDAVGGTNVPSVARRYTRGSWTVQGNHTWIISPNFLNELRIAYLHADPVTKWESQTLSTIYTRGAGNNAVPFTIGQSRQSDLWGHQLQFADTLSWTHGINYFRFGGSIVRHVSGGVGNEPGALTLGTFTFATTDAVRNKFPFNQLTLADVSTYQQPISFGIDSYRLPQWLLSGFVQDSVRVSQDLTLDLGIRYDRQTLTDATANFSPRIGFGWHPNGDARLAIRGGYGMYYTQLRTNNVASYLINGLDGISTYTAGPGQTGFPTSLTAVPVNVDPRTLPANVLPPRDITIRAGLRDFYRAQFTRYGFNFDLLQNYPDKLVNPRSQVFTIGAEREIVKGVFFGADYVRQHLSDIDRTVDLNAPTPFARTAQGQCRSANCNNTTSANLANATRPIVPANGGVRQVNVLMNLGVADYNGLQTLFTVRRFSKFYGSVSYTLSKATNTTEPDGNGVGPNESKITELGEQERGPSLVDQRHRAVIYATYQFPWNFTAGTLMQFASARPFNATTGVDNNGDGIQNDRPVINGLVIPKGAFRGTATHEVALFLENRIRTSERTRLVLRIEGFNIFNHTNMLARAVTVYGNAASGAVNTDFGTFANQFTTIAPGQTAALPAFANIDPPRMFQLQARFVF